MHRKKVNDLFTREFGLEKTGLAGHAVGMIGWIQSNKRRDILLSMWEEIHHEIKSCLDQEWDLLAAGAMQDPNHLFLYGPLVALSHWSADQEKKTKGNKKIAD